MYRAQTQEAAVFSMNSGAQDAAQTGHKRQATKTGRHAVIPRRKCSRRSSIEGASKVALDRAPHLGEAALQPLVRADPQRIPSYPHCRAVSEVVTRNKP